MATQIKIGELEIHPELMKVRKPKNRSLLDYTMKRFGVIKDLIATKKDGKIYIIDGCERLEIAKQNPDFFSTLPCNVLDIPNELVIDTHILHNTVTKRTMTELCLQIEHVLGILGHQPGTKRTMLGMDDIESNEYGKIIRDRFDWACFLVDADYSPSSVRRLMAVWWDEQKLPDKKKTGVMKYLDSGEISINKAFDLLKDKERKQKEAELIGQNHFGGDDVSFKLYNKSSMKMDEIPDNTCRLFIDSHPYFQLRGYRNQDELRHGQEPTVEKYVENFIKLCKEKKRKLVPGGIMVTILGETYRNGYQGVCRKVEDGLEKDGWVIVDNNTWGKTNPKSTPHPNRFINAKETIIVAMKPGGKPVFNSPKKPSSVGVFKVIRGSKRVSGKSGFSMSSPYADETNLIITNGFNPSEFKHIDNSFTHEAPAPGNLYRKFIGAYSNPSDTIADGFIGSGTVAVGLSMGRNIIGYDVDPVSIEFARKRCEYELEQLKLCLKIAA